jgi:TonB family protein
MNTFMNYLLEANLGLCFFLLLYLVLLKDETDFVVKRAFILISISISLIFPLIHISTQTQFVPTIGSLVSPFWLPDVTVHAEGNQAVQEASENLDAWLLTRVVYSTGVIVALLIFAARLLSLFKLIRTTPSYTIDKLTIVESPRHEHASFSFFNFIFIGKSEILSQKEKALIINHERVHAEKLHSFDVLITSIMGVFFWFNPVIRIYRKIFVHLHEYEADARAVKSHDVNDYCSLLAKVALLSADIKLASHFSNSLTLKRIQMIRTFKSKIRPWKIVTLLLAVPVFFFVVACQDQLAGNLTEIARNTSMAVNAPEAVTTRFEAVKKANPNSTYILVEFNDAAEELLTKMEKEHGIPASIELFTPDAGEYKHGTMNTGPEKITFNTSAEWESAAKGLQTFAIIEYNDAARQISENAKDENDVYTIVDDNATPVKGMPGLFGDIAEKLVYPKEAREKGLEGKVYVEFVVKTDGSISDVKAAKGFDDACDDAAVIAVKALTTKWVPGKHNGVPVKQRMILPIWFKLENIPDQKSEEKAAAEPEPSNAMHEIVVAGKTKQQ